MQINSIVVSQKYKKKKIIIINALDVERMKFINLKIAKDFTPFTRFFFINDISTKL